MAKSIEDIIKENKLLMMEYQKLAVDKMDSHVRAREINAQLQANNRDLHAFAAVLGSDDNLPRIMRFKQKGK